MEARPGATVQELIEEAGASLKEKLELGRFARLEGGYVASYLHRSDAALPPTLGVLVQLDKPSAEVAKDLAQQVAAMRPLYVTRDGRAGRRRGEGAPDRRADHPRGGQARAGHRQDRGGQAERLLQGRRAHRAGFVKDQKTTIKQILASDKVQRHRLRQVPGRPGLSPDAEVSRSRTGGACTRAGAGWC